MKIYSEEDKTIKICNTPISNIYELMEQLRIENKYLLLSEDEIQSLYKDSGVLLLGPKGDLNIGVNIRIYMALRVFDGYSIFRSAKGVNDDSTEN